MIRETVGPRSLAAGAIRGGEAVLPSSRSFVGGTGALLLCAAAIGCGGVEFDDELESAALAVKAPAISAPTANCVLPGSNVVVRWTPKKAKGFTVTAEVAGRIVYTSPRLSKTTGSHTVSNLPTNGESIRISVIPWKKKKQSTSKRSLVNCTAACAGGNCAPVSNACAGKVSSAGRSDSPANNCAASCASLGCGFSHQTKKRGQRFSGGRRSSYTWATCYCK